MIVLISMLISMVLGFIFGMIFTYLIDKDEYKGKTIRYLMDNTLPFFAFPGVGLFFSTVALLVLLLAFLVSRFLKWTKLDLVIKKIGEYINKILNTKINI